MFHAFLFDTLRREHSSKKITNYKNEIRGCDCEIKNSQTIFGYTCIFIKKIIEVVVASKLWDKINTSKSLLSTRYIFLKSGFRISRKEKIRVAKYIHKNLLFYRATFEEIKAIRIYYTIYLWIV